LQEILTQAKKVAEHAEVFRVTSRSTPLKFEANRLKQIQTKESMGTALRIIKKGRIGFAQASGKINPAELVNMALETSQFGAEAKFELPGLTTYPVVPLFDPETEKISLDDLAQLGQQLIDAIRKYSPEILCEAYLSRGNVTLEILNSQGAEVRYAKSYCSLGIEGVLIQDGDMLFVGDGQSSCHPIIDYKPISDEVIWQLEQAKNTVAIKPGFMPVIFRPHGVASALLMPLITAFNGKTVLNGASPLKDKLTTKVFDKQFSLRDDATISYQVSSSPCDDEGVPAQKTMLVENGVVAHFFYDLQTAGLANVKSTGNGSRNGGLPSPSPNSLLIGEGTTTFAEMVADIKQGLLVEQLMGATQGNVLNGDFSGNVLLGYNIENGRIAGRVKNTMVSGNVYQVLQQIPALGNDARWVDGFLHTPSIYCSNLPVATKGG
jgi:PmbA protein